MPNIETETAHRFFRPAKRSIEAYCERHAPLLHIESEASAAFFRGKRSTLKGYKERTMEKCRALPASIRRAGLLLSVVLIISPAVITTLHA